MFGRLGTTDCADVTDGFIDEGNEDKRKTQFWFRQEPLFSLPAAPGVPRMPDYRRVVFWERCRGLSPGAVAPYHSFRSSHLYPWLSV